MPPTDPVEMIRNLPDEALPPIEELRGDLRLMADEVGVRKALILGVVFSDTPIRLYGVKTWLRRWRNQAIRREFGQSMSGVALARKYNIAEKTVWNILGSTDGDDDRQLKLF